ncbi:bifunctional 3,4-dihydroxy-2-butanone-4-phosphate synthase/GTP cyclohydrolase II [Rhodococcus opacus]|uniref:bifunctional 3,4-dihydroxy-2-butanone-4-phosphate synthase/GTP cyclohydrolase II n=1 Tax=Rhodococcus opacus TaxID=37919 RepID=UPI0002A34C71|nr:bifunctional 3,4-dihydroxy-2-butanone-4-phosphate synthase/GTP cyclohydrolase II [Rhodococcus opacus]ELB90554.1 3,4-dihydroxy-2-butanone 4-phosphate synthase/GTP cyclohydrolase II [Rhodococcus wratislaviensis IFP 2016]MDJ0415629.1 bifunctional 3,4-dihydroxy-2-butanone-4-phosphate synthase/GTP cyclohydrolase II [Rhodococcus opacus]MDX5967867.1 bifunctional 3,4-dihydroxy-2-butanone-4-phosphate synthase/GTP cyclohydrolase II [Rhodococcus opacus]NKY75969.1 bifunctional 3,4-dihydroxy-2-butanone-4
MSTISDAVTALANKGMVLVVDDEDRENEGDLIMAAEYASTDAVAFFLEHTSGFLCVAIDDARADKLGLDLMVPDNTEAHKTAFLISVDYRHGTTTGISAGDRGATIRALADPALHSADLARPGHVMPLLAKPGGVLERPGHTEAGVDLCRMAGLSGAALLCEIVTPDRREMMRRDDLEQLAAQHSIPMISIAELRAWRSRTDGMWRSRTERTVTPLRHNAARSENTVLRSGRSTLPTEVGTFDALAYQAPGDGVEHMALVMGDVAAVDAPLVRLHSECITGDLAGSLRCDCGPQFRSAMSAIAEAGAGVLIYLRGHEGRGIGLGHKLRAYELQQHEGLDTIDANVSLGLPVDSRDYRVACEILDDLGVGGVRLMTNNPDKVRALGDHGITVAEQIPHESSPTAYNRSYLTTKRDRMGHTLQRLG